MHSPPFAQPGKTPLDLARKAEKKTCISLLEQATVGPKDGTRRIKTRPLMHSTSNNKAFINVDTRHHGQVFAYVNLTPIRVSAEARGKANACGWLHSTSTLRSYSPLVSPFIHFIYAQTTVIVKLTTDALVMPIHTTSRGIERLNI